jgi:hypothetical protein
MGALYKGLIVTGVLSLDRLWPLMTTSWLIGFGAHRAGQRQVPSPASRCSLRHRRPGRHRRC